jgi:peptidoglycan/xylan/chitin deacetylase (PgdA/CDA1 family)
MIAHGFPILMYHRIEDAAYMHPAGLRLSGEHCSLKRFRDHLETLRRAYQVLPLAEAASAIREGRDIPGNAAVLTFDDGTRDHVETVLPALIELDLQATFFVMSGPFAGVVPPTFKMQLITGGRVPLDVVAGDLLPRVLEQSGREFAREYAQYQSGTKLVPADRYVGEEAESVRQMKWLVNYVMPSHVKDVVVDALFRTLFDNEGEEEIARAMFLGAGDVRRLGEAGMTIGCHSRSHYNLATVRDRRILVEEIVESKDEISRTTGVVPRLFAYPAGGREGYTPECVTLVKEHYEAAVITGSQRDLCTYRDAIYELSRMHEKYFG